MNSRIRRYLLNQANAQLLSLLVSDSAPPSSYEYLHNLARLDYLRHAGKAADNKTRTAC
jgi:hypothetical protein